MVLGYGQTRMISSQDIIFFAARDGLKPGMEAQIALAWPFLLDGRVPLQLVLDTTITGDRTPQKPLVAWRHRLGPSQVVVST